eukprot:m.20896 g.20896  ORF g.20896 m.20896 type:complete len:972 (+) comp6991_c0_seq1:187-3102(+)
MSSSSRDYFGETMSNPQPGTGKGSAEILQALNNPKQKKKQTQKNADVVPTNPKEKQAEDKEEEPMKTIKPANVPVKLHRLYAQELWFAATSVMASLMSPSNGFKNILDKEFAWRTSVLKGILKAGKMEKSQDSMMQVIQGEFNLGVDGFIKVLCADNAKDPDAPLSDILGAAAVVSMMESIIVNCKGYDARSRTLLMDFAETLNVPKEQFQELEGNFIEFITTQENDESLSEEAKKEHEAQLAAAKRSRMWKIGVGTVVGGVIVGVTGGLAAPFLAAGAGVAFGASTGAALATTTGIYVVGAVFGASGAGLLAHKTNRRYGDLSEFEFVHVHLTEEEKLAMEEAAEKRRCRATSMSIFGRSSSVSKSGQDKNSKSESQDIEKLPLLEERKESLSDNKQPAARESREKTDNKKQSVDSSSSAPTGKKKSSLLTFFQKKKDDENASSDESEKEKTEKEAPIKLPESTKLHVIINVNGWIPDGPSEDELPSKNFTELWEDEDDSASEIFALKWESRKLHEFAGAIKSFIVSQGVSYGAATVISHTVFATLAAAAALPVTLMSAAAVIDNPLGVCLNLSKTAGLELAQALLSRAQGNRPVTLVGNSFGALVIFEALKYMATRSNNIGIVQDVYLFGAPVTGKASEWEPISPLISGRIVNCASSYDWVVRMITRGLGAEMSVAGLDGIANDRVLNLEVSHIVKNHSEYYTKMPALLRLVGLSKDFDSQPCPGTIGHLVSVRDKGLGILRYFGFLKTGLDRTTEYCGVSLYNPLGDNNGEFQTHRYFSCQMNHGIFVPSSEITVENATYFGEPEDDHQCYSPTCRARAKNEDDDDEYQCTCYSPSHKCHERVKAIMLTPAGRKPPSPSDVDTAGLSLKIKGVEKNWLTANEYEIDVNSGFITVKRTLKDFQLICKQISSELGSDLKFPKKLSEETLQPWIEALAAAIPMMSGRLQMQTFTFLGFPDTSQESPQDSTA